ncbi:pyridoxal phosphate-dependent transferase [Xylariomycetidae sp. FL2044]|nr:pyridoxal phosphate-dependent transferase [Xylariomycetidae sp. FL2044]
MKVYNNDVEAIRRKEYPHMNDGAYLDHSGATIYAKSTIESFARKLTTNLYGNPHSENSPAKLSGDVVDAVREKTLRYLGADPEEFDLVFVANATAAIKLVADSFRDLAEKTADRTFWYGYHKDAHTSVVGVRELTHGQCHCFETDKEVDRWLHHPDSSSINRRQPDGLGLFAYPGQSNMSGRRLPLSWPSVIRESEHLQNTYTLLDAAALAMTFPMENVFGDVDGAPDFTCLSLYKIFGFPDIGALIVRKQSGHILTLRKYFGGGTVSMVSTFGETTWHRSKGLQAPAYQLHEGLEDGTLPFHNILALGEAIDVHRGLFGTMARISEHTSYLISRLYRGMYALSHANGRPLCRIYSENENFEDSRKQGSVVAFNIIRSNGHYVPYSDVEKAANSARIYVRSGGVCNPGGIFTALGYEPWMTERALSAGHHCGSRGINILHRRPTGIVRASLGAMSTRQDVDTFLEFLRTTFVEADSHDWASCTTALNRSPDSSLSKTPASEIPNDYGVSRPTTPDPRHLPRGSLRPVPHHFVPATTDPAPVGVAVVR